MQPVGLALEIVYCHLAFGSVLDPVQFIRARINSQSFTVADCIF
ncbi:MAG: hypothetical protein ABSE86_02925 [Bryobacteraceae bacterium]|jgi:hypothetical protein